MLFDSESPETRLEYDGRVNPPPFWVCAQAGGILSKIDKPQLKANTPADFALERVLFIVSGLFSQVLNGNLYGFPCPSYRCK